MKKATARITAVHSRFQSADVRIKEDLDFSSLISSPLLLRGLTAAGYQRPSPIQLKAIPLGRLGLDIIAQAKSGTGKTIVFSVIAIEAALGRSLSSPSSTSATTTAAAAALATCLKGDQDNNNNNNNNSSLVAKGKRGGKLPQVIILAPTREIAVQITEVIQALTSQGLQDDVVCHTFIGGLPVKEDKKRLLDCSIVVGTPGRVRQLIESGDLKTSQIRLLVLDEADKLMEEAFQGDVVSIAQSAARGGMTRQKNQVMAFSATYDDELLAALDKIVKNNPQHIMLCSDQRAPELAGVMQYYKVVHASNSSNNNTSAPASSYFKQAKIFESKRQALRCLLEQVPFHQAFVFLNHHGRALELVKYLDKRGWPALFIASAMTQEERLQVMAKARNFEVRVLVCTDLIARGIDIERVNLVISLDMPRDAETYFHRIGRTGRFGTMGLAVGILDKEEAETLEGWRQEYGLHVQHVLSASEEGDEPMETNGRRLNGIGSASTNKVYDFSLLNQQTQHQHYERPLQNEEDLAQFEKLETLRQQAAISFVEEEEEEEKEEEEEENDEQTDAEMDGEGEEEETLEENITEEQQYQEMQDRGQWYPDDFHNAQAATATQEHSQSWEWWNNYSKYYDVYSSNQGIYTGTYPSHPPWHPSYVYYYQHYHVPSPTSYHQYPASYSTHTPAPSFIPPDLPF
ncbi:DEAD (Asp-Glu-Ala-Asp) box polypeptide 20 [Actinomortierella wolfii]|nr:DEAD (Asp-Glu-Ala-Asp) box polypeptide 20 [Actinomortierella wolfii]